MSFVEAYGLTDGHIGIQEGIFTDQIVLGVGSGFSTGSVWFALLFIV